MHEYLLQFFPEIFFLCVAHINVLVQYFRPKWTFKKNIFVVVVWLYTRQNAAIIVYRMVSECKREEKALILLLLFIFLCVYRIRVWTLNVLVVMFLFFIIILFFLCFHFNKHTTTTKKELDEFSKFFKSNRVS